MLINFTTTTTHNTIISVMMAILTKAIFFMFLMCVARTTVFVDSAPPSNLPTNVDWCERGAVTFVSSQGTCKCCWAFTVVATVEGIFQIKENTLIKLSEQELVDCDAKNQGCRDSGLVTTAYQYIVDNGICSRESYPYIGKKGSCRRDRGGMKPEVHITAYARVPYMGNREENIQLIVVKQPVAAAVVVSEAFEKYKGGIFKGPCEVNLQELEKNIWHGVTIVGYGIDSDGTKYWLIKNSWGTTWGDNGYMRLLRDVGDSPLGLCAIAKQAYYPIL